MKHNAMIGRKAHTSRPQCAAPVGHGDCVKEEETGSVRAGIVRLGLSIDYTAKAIDRLRMALAPVLQNVPNAACLDAEKVGPIRCEVGDQILAKADEVAELEQQINDLIKRVDI